MLKTSGWERSDYDATEISRRTFTLRRFLYCSGARAYREWSGRFHWVKLYMLRRGYIFQRAAGLSAANHYVVYAIQRHASRVLFSLVCYFTSFIYIHLDMKEEGSYRTVYIYCLTHGCLFETTKPHFLCVGNSLDLPAFRNVEKVFVFARTLLVACPWLSWIMSSRLSQPWFQSSLVLSMGDFEIENFRWGNFHRKCTFHIIDISFVDIWNTRNNLACRFGDEYWHFLLGLYFLTCKESDRNARYVSNRT